MNADLMSADAARPAFRHPDEQPLAEYRGVSKLAILAALLGAASVLMLVSLLFLPLALVAMVVAVVALRSIAASEGQLLGRWPAVIGLALAVLFVAWGATRHFTRQTQLETHARQLAESWLALVQAGKQKQAHQLELPGAQRLGTDEAIEQYYAENMEAREAFQARMSAPPVSEIMAAGQQAPYSYEGVAHSLHQGFTDFITLKYVVERAANQGGPLPVWIEVKRVAAQGGRAVEWTIASIDARPPATGE